MKACPEWSVSPSLLFKNFFSCPKPNFLEARGNFTAISYFNETKFRSIRNFMRKTVKKEKDVL